MELIIMGTHGYTGLKKLMRAFVTGKPRSVGGQFHFLQARQR